MTPMRRAYARSKVSPSAYGRHVTCEITDWEPQGYRRKAEGLCRDVVSAAGWVLTPCQRTVISVMDFWAIGRKVKEMPITEMMPAQRFSRSFWHVFDMSGRVYCTHGCT